MLTDQGISPDSIIVELCWKQYQVMESGKDELLMLNRTKIIQQTEHIFIQSLSTIHLPAWEHFLTLKKLNTIQDKAVYLIGTPSCTLHVHSLLH